MDDAMAWALEHRLWLEGKAAYGSLLDPACLMAFPGGALLDARDVLKRLPQAPRWSSVTVSERRIGRPAVDVIVLAYKAEGRRAEGEQAEPYRCVCTSTYRHDGNRWRLVRHQQTLAD